MGVGPLHIIGNVLASDIRMATPILIAANPVSDVETNYTKIRDLRELIL